MFEQLVSKIQNSVSSKEREGEEMAVVVASHICLRSC